MMTLSDMAGPLRSERIFRANSEHSEPSCIISHEHSYLNNLLGISFRDTFYIALINDS